MTDSRNSSGKIFEYSVASDGSLSPTAPGTVPSISLAVPTQLSLTPGGSFAYTTHDISNKAVDELLLDGAGALSAVSGSPLSVTNHLRNVAVAPDGVDVYFAEQTTSGAVRHGRIQPDGRLGALDSTAANPNTTDVVVTPDGRFVYAANDNGTVSRYTVNANGTLNNQGTIAVGSNLRSLAVAPDGQKLFVGSGGDGRIYSFRINSDGTLSAPPAPSIAGGTADMAVAPLGGFAYSTGGSSVYQFQINADSSLTALSPASVSSGGDGAQGIEVSPDGKSLYAVNHDDGGVAQYDVAAGGTLSAKSPATVVPDSDSHSKPYGAAVQPAQGPAASLTATPGGAFTVQFDASGSSGAGSAILSYAFDFGDGTSTSGSSPAVTHTYAGPGSYVVQVTVTNAAGLTSRGVYTGHSMLVNGGQSAALVGISPAGTVTVTQLNGPTAFATAANNPLILPAGLFPVNGRTLIATPVAKGVLVKLPGSNRFVPLETVVSIPVGTIIDAGKGVVRLTAATDAQGHTNSAEFYGGTFQVLQQRGNAFVELRLLGVVGPCSVRTKKSASAARKRRSRHVWGNGHGSFRTRGRYASATVRGTVWLTKDTCSGTLTVVRRGTVTVRDFVRRKTVVVKAGKSYLAKAGKKK